MGAAATIFRRASRGIQIVAVTGILAEWGSRNTGLRTGRGSAACGIRPADSHHCANRVGTLVAPTL